MSPGTVERRGSAAAARRSGGPSVVALDIGSSSVRAGLFDSRARLVADRFVQRPYAMDVDGHGGVRIELRKLFDVVGATLDDFVAVAGEELGAVAAVGTSCFLHSIVGLDPRGQAVTPMLSWADTTSAAAAATLRGELDEAELWQATGCPIRASYWPPKIVHLRETTDVPIVGWAGAPDLLFEALTGWRAADLSMASGTGLLDRTNARWHQLVLDHLGIDEAALPELVTEPGAAHLTGWAAKRWPSLAGVPWFLPWSDGSCGNVGLGGVAGGSAALMIGTSGAMRVILDNPAPRIVPGLFAHRLSDGTTLVGGQLSEGGAVIASTATLLGRKPHSLENEAERLAPDSHGLTVLPYLAGERGPGYHDEARGVIAGLDLATGPAQLYRALLEAIALRFAAIDARLCQVVGREPAVVVGGGAMARSPLWARIVAAALGRDIALSRFGEVSSRGAALYALSAVGAIGSPADVPPPAARTVQADPGWIDVYRRAADRQERLYRTILGSDGE